MSRQQLLLRQKLTVSQILRTYGRQYRQIQMQYSDGHNGRCAIGVIMSYFGWDGVDGFDTSRVLAAALGELKRAGIDEDLLIELNDSGLSLDEIADNLDRTNELTNSK
jgi:hypothetical protein